MCGRYAIFGPRSITREEKAWLDRQIWDSENQRPPEFEFMGEDIPMEPNYDCRPTEHLPIITCNDGPGGLEQLLFLARWGFLPAGVGSIERFARQYSTFNAKSEGVATSRLYGKALRERRCLVPMNGFYEWQQRAKMKIRHYIKLRDPRMFACAGLWSVSKLLDGRRLASFTILTCEANELVAEIHTKKRMPVIIPRDLREHWLHPQAEEADIAAMLRPFPAGEMVAYPVRNTAVGPDLIEPAGKYLSVE
jgi:putative SOS response-associated peptidase YedK